MKNTPPIHVLFIDTTPPLYDAVSAVLHASKQPFTLTPISSLEELEHALNERATDCVLCNLHATGDFPTDQCPTGLLALQRVQRHPAAVPLIMLCAATDEDKELASQAIWQGAADYLLNDALLRLPAAIRSAVQHHTLLNHRAPADNELQLALTILRGSRDGICITDTTGTILMVNDSFTQITGYTQDEVKGKNPRLLKSELQTPEFYADLWASLTTQGNWQGEVINRAKDGSTYSEWLRISTVHDASGHPTHYIGQFGYVAEQKRLVDRISHLTQFDPLTGLPNRSLFIDRMEQALITAQRSARCAAVILVNLDRFRLINDSLGQAVGDRVLIDMAGRFIQQIRQGDTVARLSGNEFCFLLSNLSAAEDAIQLAQRLQEAIAQPMEHAGHPLIVAASIGISVSPKDGNSGDALLKAADAALIRAKLEGGNNISFYSPGMEADARRRQIIEAQLRGALERNEFSVVYQAQNSLESGKLIGTEALLRWHNIELDMVSPSEFIPVAEECGLIIPIGSWVLRQACAQNMAWQDQGLTSMRVAVNLSARQFRGDTLVEEVAAVLKETGLPAEFLELEVTESALIHNVDAAVATCRKLKALGCKLSLDDFGTGYSSLAYVARFPFDKLKIDQGFVRDITHNPANAAIATAAIAMAHGLNLSVLAEGVETEAQALFLRNRRCDAMQGYLFSRPSPPEVITALLIDDTRLSLGLPRALSEQTLLIIDDEPSILSAMTRLFRHENYRVITASRSAEAFEHLAQNSVQVIISDQRMPGMSGTEFFARVRQLYPNSIRIILSGYTELASVMDAINEGAVYKFLTKPWEDDQLREQVREAFRIAAHKGQKEDEA